MTTKLTALLGSLSLALACLLPAGSAPAAAQRAPAVAVVIGSNSRITDLSSGTLRTLFLNLQVTHQGERLVPFNLPASTALRVRFDRAVLGLAPHAVGPFWIDQRVRDGRRPPREVPNPELGVRVAANLPGAVVYVPLELTGIARIRVLRIDGRAPGDHEYAIP